MKKVLYKLMLAICLFCWGKVAFAEEVDVILFTGQSNMVGYGADDRFLDMQDKSTKNNIDFSNMNGNVYEFKYVNEVGELIKYDANNNIPAVLGETVDYCDYSGDVNCRVSQEGNYALISSFVEDYVEKTGHSVVIVPSAVSGKGIKFFQPNACFLPQDVGQSDFLLCKNMFNRMSEKYLAAINYLIDHEYTVGNKFYVIYDGETDGKNSLDEYKQYYYNFHDSLIKRLNLEFGAMIVPGPYFNNSDMTVCENNECKMELYVKSTIEGRDNLVLASNLTVSMWNGQYNDANKNNFFVDIGHFKLPYLKNIGKDAASNIISQRSLDKYEIVFDCSGTGDMPGMSITYGVPTNLNKNICEKQGYVFDGWHELSNPEKVYADQAEVLNVIPGGRFTEFVATWKESGKEKAPSKIDNPPTGMFVSMSLIFVSGVLLIVCLVLSKKYHKIFKI